MGTLLLALAAALSGCTSSGAVRSAEVRPGPSLLVQMSGSTPPGEHLARLWTDPDDPDGAVPGVDVSMMFGRSLEGGRAYAVGGGFAGVLLPFVDGYYQLGGGDRPYGIGARFGFFPNGGGTQRLYGRWDLPVEGGGRILLNPSLFYSRDETSTRSTEYVGASQGVGYLIEGGRLSLIPAASLVFVSGEGRDFDERHTFQRVFLTISVGVELHRRRD